MAQLIVCLLIAGYLLLTPNQWKLIFKAIIYSVVGFLKATRWMIIGLMFFGASISTPVYNTLGCTPASIIGMLDADWYRKENERQAQREALEEKQKKDNEYWDELTRQAKAREAEKFYRDSHGR